MNQSGEFEIGSQEKHLVSFSLGAWLGTFTVKVDGNKTAIDRASIISGPYTIEVGDKEKHTVTFQISMKAIAAAFRKKDIQVLIDNKVYKTF